MESRERIPSSGRYALTLLLAVNLLNYLDRQVIFAVFPLIKIDLGLSDTALGLLGSSFMLSYLVIAPLFGWLGDRGGRVRIASLGVGVWSFATALSGLAPTYPFLLGARSLVGIGEASFGTVSPSLLSDFFPKEVRGRILSYFYLAIPVGSAVGYVLGGILGQAYGWHSAFLIVGLPGLGLAALTWFLREPAPRDSTSEDPALRPSYGSLGRNRSFVLATLAMAAMTFALGGLAQWMPTFLYRLHGLDVAKGNTIFGAITVVAGLAGTLAGGWLGDLMQRRTRRGYLLVSGVGFLVGTPLAALAILAQSLPLSLGAMLLGEFFLFLNTGPLNTVILNVTPRAVRSMAFAVNIFVIHILGDAISPTILGRLSDLWELRTSLLLTPVAMALAGALCFLCMGSIGADSQRVAD
jgi:MFS family permease